MEIYLKMDLLISLKKLLKRIDEIDKRSKKMSENTYYASNPFAVHENKTYVWIEKVKDFNKCELFKKEHKNN